jgi:long-chain acyl-CoA synthetase
MGAMDHLDTHATLIDAFRFTTAERPAAIALSTADGTVHLSWTQVRSRVEALAGGLAGLGVGAGDTVALMLRNRPEFHLLDTAALHLGAIPWSVYLTSSPQQIRFQLRGADTRVVLVEPDLRERIEVAVVGTSVVHVVGLDELDRLPTAPPGFDLSVTAAVVRPESPLTIIWTSGTTGEPKPVELSHAGMIAMLRGWVELSEQQRGGRGMSYLPSAHVADRYTSLYWWAVGGAEIVCLPDGSTVVSALPSIRPTRWGSVPRVWEKLRAGLEAQGVLDPAGMPEAARLAIRRQLGLDRVELLVSGAAPLAAETLHYFDALGLPICELWGLSESSGVLTANPRSNPRYGSVGRPLRGVELRIADDGEVLARGPQLMLGYRNRPDLTSQAIIGGWLHTGDIGILDADGYLRIVDRKKELIINAAGKNMSPLGIENALKTAGRLIGQACVVGDGRRFNVALLVLDADAARAWAAKQGRGGTDLATLIEDPRLLDEVAQEVAAANERLSRVEHVRRWRILPTDWLPDGEELTPTMKLKRRAIHAKYAEQIDELYV